MARGSSTSSSEAPMKTNLSSASQVNDTKKVKFRTTSPNVSARKSRLSHAKMATANSRSIVDTGTENTKPNIVKTRASFANNTGPSISLNAKNACDGNKRNIFTRNTAPPTRSREVQSSNDTPTSYLTSNKNIKSNVIPDNMCSRTRCSATTSSSSQSEIETATVLNSPNTRRNTKKTKSKHSVISACRKSGLSRNGISTTVNNSNNNNNSSIMSTKCLGRNNGIVITEGTSKDTYTNTNIALKNDNIFHRTNNSHCSESPTTSPISRSCTKPNSPSYTIGSLVTSKQHLNEEDGIASKNTPMHWSDGKMCKEAHNLVELPSNLEMRLPLNERPSSALGEVEVDALSADGIDNQHKTSVPEKLKDFSATHMASYTTLSPMQCGSQSSLAGLENTHDMMPEEGVATMTSEEGTSSEVACSLTPNKSLLLPHQQRRQETCLHCGAVVEFILSHLVHSRRCQGSYDLDTLEQVARRRSSSGTTFLSDPSSQSLDTIPPVGASVEVANDASFLQEDHTNDIIQVESDTNTHMVVGSEHMVYSEQNDIDLDNRVTDDGEDFSEPYFLCEDNLANNERNYPLSPVTNNNSSPWQQSSVEVKYKLPPMAATRTVARKVKELSKASVMARKVMKTPVLQPDHSVDLVNLVRLHSKGGVPIVMRKRKKTLQEEIEEEEMEERRRRPVITARMPFNSKFYHRRREASNSVSDEDNRQQHCQSNYVGTTETVRKKKRLARLPDSCNLNEVHSSETVQTTVHSSETHPHTTKGAPPDVWKQDLRLMQQKLLDFQERLKVCERLTEDTLEQEDGTRSDTRKRGSENAALRYTPTDEDRATKHDRLSGSLDAEQLLEEGGSGRDFFEANEDWFIPEKLTSDRRKRGAHKNARMDSKFGVKRKIVAPLHFNKDLSDVKSRGVDNNINNNKSNNIGNTQTEVEFVSSNEDMEDMPDYFDEDFLRQHFKMRSTEHQRSPSPSSPARGRRIHIKRTECKSCGAKIKYILSHLSKSFKCQSLYDMTLLRAQSSQNKRLRQRHYERQHKSIIKERQRQYYHDKREALRNNKKLYYLQNRDSFRAQQSEYYDKTYQQQREKKRLYYIRNSERIRERHRRYNTVYRQRQWNKRLQLDLLHYRREMVERGEDPDASEQVVEMTQNIMALPTDIEGIKRTMVAAGTFCGDLDEMRRGKVAIDSWRRNARAWVGGRRLLCAGGRGGPRESVWTPRQHVPSNAKRSVARVKRLGDGKVIKLTKAGDAAGGCLDGEERGDYDFMMAADQVIIEAVGDLELGEEIQHDIEYVADGGGDAALVEEIHIQEERSYLTHDEGPDGGRHHLEEEVARVGEVQTEIHEDHNHVSFVQTLIEGESFCMHEEEDSNNQNDEGAMSVVLGRGASSDGRRRKKRRGSNSRRALPTDKRVSFKYTVRTTNDEDNLDETDAYRTNNDEDNLGETDAYQPSNNEDNLGEAEGTKFNDGAQTHDIPDSEDEVGRNSVDVTPNLSSDHGMQPAINS